MTPAMKPEAIVLRRNDDGLEPLLWDGFPVGRICCGTDCHLCIVGDIDETFCEARISRKRHRNGTNEEIDNLVIPSKKKVEIKEGFFESRKMKDNLTKK